MDQVKAWMKLNDIEPQTRPAAPPPITLWCGCTSSRSGGIMLTASCREMLPVSVSAMRNWCRRQYGSQRRMSRRVRFSCHARFSGYLGRRFLSEFVEISLSPFHVQIENIALYMSDFISPWEAHWLERFQWLLPISNLLLSEWQNLQF